MTHSVFTTIKLLALYALTPSLITAKKNPQKKQDHNVKSYIPSLFFPSPSLVFLLIWITCRFPSTSQISHITWLLTNWRETEKSSTWFLQDTRCQPTTQPFSNTTHASSQSSLEENLLPCLLTMDCCAIVETLVTDNSAKVARTRTNNIKHEVKTWFGILIIRLLLKNFLRLTFKLCLLCNVPEATYT